MVSAEGVFPKIGNDPMYASEYNRFAQSNKYSFIGSTDWGVSGVLAKTFSIGIGSLSNPCKFYYNLTLISEDGGRSSGVIQFSGTEFGDNTIRLNAAIINGVQNTMSQGNGMFGSPFKGAFYGWDTDQSTLEGVKTFDNGARKQKLFSNNYTGSGFDINLIIATSGTIIPQGAFDSFLIEVENVRYFE